MDPVIAQAAEVASLDSTQIHTTFPSELTLWIDPMEVSYRIGENGSISILYEFKEDCINEPWRPNMKSKEDKSIQSQDLDTTNQDLDHNYTSTLRKMDYLLDPRKSVSIEQLAAYVSSS